MFVDERNNSMSAVEVIMSTENEIRNYAYQLWEKAGCPVGRDDEFWRMAKAELDAESENPDPATQKTVDAPTR
jgi:hypothetical protein